MTPPLLLDWLEQYQFLTPAQAAELRPLLPTLPDLPALIRELMRREWIAPYQANQIAQGKQAHLLLGCYRLRERVGEGAMGQVFKAWNTRLHRVVAVKTIHKELVASAKTLDRFRREMETAAQLDHPHIVMVRDADEVDGRPFLVMDYIDGTTLSQLVKQQGPLPVVEAVEYIRQAALGLQHASERGIVHRDVKPGNLILVQEDGGKLKEEHSAETPFKKVKILDFGLARFESERNNSSPRLTQIGHLLGTVDYIAPEQAENAHGADCRADIYSLGCTLHFLLTGKPPFGGENLVAKVSARLSGPVPQLSAARPDVPAGLDAVFQKMMARRPADRYQTPAEVAAALAPFTGQPSAEAPASEAPIPLALPVAWTGDDVPLALPVTAQPAAIEAAEAEPEATPETAWTPPLERRVPAAPRTSPPAKTALPLGLLASVMGGFALLLCTGGGWFVFRGCDATPDKKGYWDPNAALHITKVRLSNDIIHPGERKFVLVYIARTEFKGPVKIHVEGTGDPEGKLPDGVQTGTTVISENADRGDLSLTVSYGIAPFATELKVVAVAENLTDAKVIPLNVTRGR